MNRSPFSFLICNQCFLQTGCPKTFIWLNYHKMKQWNHRNAFAHFSHNQTTIALTRPITLIYLTTAADMHYSTMSGSMPLWWRVFHLLFCSKALNMNMQLMKPGHMYISINTTELLITVCNHQHLYGISVSIEYRYTNESFNQILNNLKCFWRGHIFCQRLILNCIITLYWFPFITKHI